MASLTRSSTRLRPQRRDFAQEYLDSKASRKACNSCKHPNKPIYCKGLCKSCHSIEIQIDRLSAKVDAFEEQQRETGRVRAPFEELDYRVALSMKRSAEAEGEDYRRSYVDAITGHDIEEKLRWISRKVAGKDLCGQLANVFDWSFTPSQKRLLFHLLSIVHQGHLRRRRKHLALNDPEL